MPRLVQINPPARDVDATNKKYVDSKTSAVADAVVEHTITYDHTNIPTDNDTNIHSAVTLKHTQGADQGLDTGGANEVTVANAKDAVTKKHARSHTIASTDDHSDWPAGLDVTELGYVNGVTSEIQTQLGTKAPTATPTFTGQATIPTINLTGGQVVFPAVQAASANANTLDDYEEGAWTPDLQFGGAKVGITYNAAGSGGCYTKIGRLVVCTGRILLTSKGSSVGDAALFGLPFAGSALIGAWSTPTLELTNVSFADFPQGDLYSNSSFLGFYEITNAGARTTLTDANFANNSAVVFSVSYFI